MHTVVLCATRRGLRFLEKLSSLLPGSTFTIFSFKEKPWEPPFLEDIREFTKRQGWQFYEEHNVDDEKFRSFWSSQTIDLMFLVSWRFKISQKVYSKARLGAYLFHDSLLPKNRGFSPTVWSMIKGEPNTGVTILEVAEEVDSGAIVDQVSVSIGHQETIQDVLERVTENYLMLLEKNIDLIVKGHPPKRKNDSSQATYCKKRIPDDNVIDWNDSAENVYNLIRAVSAPYPGAFTYYEGKKVTVWSAAEVAETDVPADAVPGSIVASYPGRGSLVALGKGGLMLHSIQREGDEIKCAAEVLKAGISRLGTEPAA